LSRRSIIASVAAVIAVGSLCFLLVGAAFCGATLHVPRRLGPAPANATTVSLITSDKVNLSAWWLRPARRNGNCVLVLHGIGDSRVGSIGYAPMFLSEGYSVLLPDSRAHGASEGRFVTYGLLEKYDVLAWAEWMQRAGCGKLYALGESLGASILIQAAAMRPSFAAIVAESPYADLREIAEYRVRQMSRLPRFVAVPTAKMVVRSAVFYARWMDDLRLEQVSPVRVIGRASTPILLVHGLKDFRTPASNSERLAKANPRDSLWLVRNARHTGAAAAEPEEFHRRVLAWFAAH
jgi:dipeptidyl aminopeptidase/acylaminoacyl peptidase